MANAATHIDRTNPTLQRARALLALAFQYFGDPARARDLQLIYEKSERLLVRVMFETAARMAGRLDVLHTHEAYTIHKRGVIHYGIREKVSALPPLHQIIYRRRHATALNRIRTALGCRSRVSTKPSHLRITRKQPRHAVTTTSRRARTASPSHTPSRISAPP